MPYYYNIMKDVIQGYLMDKCEISSYTLLINDSHRSLKTSTIIFRLYKAENPFIKRKTPP